MKSWHEQARNAIHGTRLSALEGLAAIAALVWSLVADVSGMQAAMVATMTVVVLMLVFAWRDRTVPVTFEGHAEVGPSPAAIESDTGASINLRTVHTVG